MGADAASARRFQFQFALRLVGAHQPVLEMQLHLRMLLGLVQQQVVEQVAVDRMQHFAVVLAVRLVARAAVRRMDDPAAHDDGMRQHLLQQAHHLQGLHAALGQAQVDRAARRAVLAARVGPALIHVDAMALPRQRQRQQGTGQAAADDGDALAVGGAHAVSPAPSASGSPRRACHCSISAATTPSSACSKRDQPRLPARRNR